MRTMVFLLFVGWTGVCSAQTELQSPNGLLYRIADGTHGGLETPAHLAGWPQLCVRVCAECDEPCAEQDLYVADGPRSFELNERQVLMGSALVAGLTVQRRMFVPPAGNEVADGFLRYFDTLTNPQDVPITVAIRLGSVAQNGPFIAPDFANLWRTHSDDAVLEPSDRWFLLDDQAENGGSAALAVLIQGAGAQVGLARAGQGFLSPDQTGSIGWEYRNVRIEPQQTVAILTVLTQDVRRRDSLLEVRSLQRVRPVDVIAGLTDEQRAQVINFDIHPDNAAPVANAGGPYTVNEGLPIELSGLASFDAEGAQLQYAWDLSDDGQLRFDDADTANTNALFMDDGVYSVALRVTDEGGKVDIDTARVQVLNVAPRIDAISTSSPINEGDRLSIEVRVTDPGDDLLTFSYDWQGDGEFDEQLLAQDRVEQRYREDGRFNLRVAVEDDDGGRVEQETEVVVRNLPPLILQVLAPDRVLEADEFSIQVIARDPGNDPMTYAYDLDGDGVFERAAPDLNEVELSFPDDGLYTVGIRLCDDQNACAEREVSINVQNRRPELARIEVTSPIQEGGTARINVVATDVPDDPLTYAFDFDNDGDFADDIPGQAESQVFVPFEDDGRFTVGVRIEDGDGGRIVDAVEVVVENVAPTVVIQGPAGTRQGVEETFTCQASDPGADRLVYDWDFDGDGQFELRDARFEETVAFPVQADLDISCRVSDGDGGVTTAVHRIAVANERPTLEILVESPQPEGTEVAVRAVAEDAGNDELLYSFDFEDDGVIDVGPTDQPIARHRYLNQGEFTIRVFVTDGVDSIDASVRLLVVNRPPIVRLTSNSPINEGEDLEFEVEVIEYGDDDVTLRWDLDGDGMPDPGVVDAVGDEVVTRSLTTTDDGRFNVTVWADDGDGGIGQDEIAVNVRNLPPSFPDNYRPPPAYEGRPYNRSIPAFDVAGPNDPLRFSLVEPLPGIDIEENTGLLLWVPTYSNVLSSPITMRVRVDDGDGGTSQRDIEFEVIAIDEDEDGLPDSYESMTCSADGVCLDPTDPADAAADPDMDGRDNRTEWEEGTNPFEFEGPQMTRLLEPEDGNRVGTLTPLLTAERAEDTQGEQVTIQFQVFRDEALEEELVLSEPVVQQAEGNVSWTVPAELLEEDVSYWWRARVLTNTAQTRYTGAWRFRTNAENTVPTSPMPIAPPDGARLDTLQPVLRVTRATDADEDALRYIFRVYDQNGEIYTRSEGVVMEEEVHFETPALPENGRFTWDAVAIDEVSAESAPWMPWSFVIDAGNTVPSVPELLSPEGESIVDTLTPTFSARGSQDDDGDAIAYVFSVLSESGEILETGDSVEPDEGGQANWTVLTPLSEDTAYIAAVYVEDVRGGVSETVTAPFFVSAENAPPPTPQLVSPVDGSQLTPGDLTLFWDTVADPEGARVTYVVEYCLDADCVRAPPQDVGALNLSTEVIPGAAYTWRVEAFDPDGNSAGPSEPWTFRVIDVDGGSEAGGCGCTVHHRRLPSAEFLLFAMALILGVRRRNLR